MVEHITTPSEISDVQHCRRLDHLRAELGGVISAALGMRDEGRISADEALAMIREKYAQTDAEADAAWDRYAGRA